MLLRWGLAFTFFYAAIASLRDGSSWIGFVPDVVETVISKELFLTLMSVGELALAAWLFWGWMLEWSALVSFAMLAGITVFNLGPTFDITFRDVGLALAALALYDLAKRQRTEGGLT